ncbi:hypothetical protein KIN20_010936 [Parelaphostrongylus tenuis]|uniref:RRM domain-containing protein n=1 Tax=Parelaphostrongylus tenuis TaxID=148309 RepID=A0AAD5QKN1_PARTN|nr:hypothetical protein KIN20_010936 [Parelaphostrongylus tenuis]
MNERGSKGFGFVTLDSTQGSEAARAALNGIVVVMDESSSCPPRPPSVAPPESNIVLPQENPADVFGFRLLHHVQPHSFLRTNSATEQFNALLLAQNHLNLQRKRTIS